MVRVFLNGEVIFTVKNSSQGKPSFGGNFDQISAKGKHSAGNVTGLSMSEFVAMPARAQITLVYEGESTGEGFFTIQKL